MKFNPGFFLADSKSIFSPRGIWLSPAGLTFIASLILSAIAIYVRDDPGRDGMLYIETASIFLESGLSAARASFDWVFYPVCIGVFSKLTGLGVELSAYAFSALLFAGVCATLVRLMQIQFPAAVWYVCLVVLALPKFNDQRSVIIREFGYWLFCLQSLLAALRWQKNPTYAGGLIVQSMLLMAALFRVEALVFFAALALWQLFTRLPWKVRFQRMSMLIGLPLMAFLALSLLIIAGKIDMAGRLSNYALAANPFFVFKNFRDVADQLAATVLNHYSADEAGTILFFGLLSTIAVKFVTNNGIFLVPLVLFFCTGNFRQRLSEWRLQSWFFIVYALVLGAFVSHHLFISARYVSFLNILLIPLLALGLKEMFERYSRWRPAFLALVMLFALANVVSFSPRKTQYRDAGAWLSAHADMAPRTYIDDARIRYFASSAFKKKKAHALSPEAIEAAIHAGEVDYLVVGISRRLVGKAQWFHALPLEEIKRFENKAGEAVLVLRRV